MAVKEFKVLVGAITVALDKEGKNVKRVMKDELVKLDDSLDSVKAFIEHKAIGGKDDESTSAADLSAAVGSDADTPQAPPADTGQTADATPNK